MMTLNGARRKGPVAFLTVAATVASTWAVAVPAEAVVAQEPGRTASFNGRVLAVAYHGDRVYVGGNFTRATDRSGTVNRQHVAALNARTGQLLPWRPRVDGRVRDIDVRRGAVYLGGAFAHVNGRVRHNLAKVTAGRRGHLVKGFRHGTDDTVRALEVTARRLYLGGDFSKVDGRARERLASVNLRSGSLAGWAPRANASVFTIRRSKGRVYVGGLFSRLNGQTRAQYLAAVRPFRQVIDGSFDPQISYAVNDIAVARGTVYAGADGPGGHLRAFTLSGRGRFDLTTNGALNAVAVLGRTIYFGGHFTAACNSPRTGNGGSCVDGSRQRMRLAAASLSGELRAWHPWANSGFGIAAIDAGQRRGKVAAGGDFTLINGQRHGHFAQFSTR